MGAQHSDMDSEKLEGDVEAFRGESTMEVEEIFPDERFPNAVVALDGAVVATWGHEHLVARRSEDGGATWGDVIPIGDGIHGGGTTVDEASGDLLVFGHPQHPPTDTTPASRTVYRSGDGGRSWAATEADFATDAQGYLPSLHFAEHGVTLRRGPHAGRLLRPARVYDKGAGGYNTAIFSDDGGRTWQCSQPFPVEGTGEGAAVELSDGRIYYSSRRHRFFEGEQMRWERLRAWSDDGGATWTDPQHHLNLPDGPRYRGEEGRGANHQGHFGMAGGLTRLPVTGRDILIYSNADEEGHERVRMTAWASLDGGQTWPVRRLVDEGPGAYSSLEAGRPGTPSEGWIYLQYEERGGGGRMARFNLSWLLAGEATGDGQLP